MDPLVPCDDDNYNKDHNDDHKDAAHDINEANNMTTVLLSIDEVLGGRWKTTKRQRAWDKDNDAMTIVINANLPTRLVLVMVFAICVSSMNRLPHFKS